MKKSITYDIIPVNVREDKRYKYKFKEAVLEKILGIIAEYNPLHNGHIYHIKKSKEVTGADYAVAVISGNFTQRGEPSIVSKWNKAKMAIDSGEIDLVIELPTLYGISSAESFANGGVEILNELGITDCISFGIENDNIEEIKQIAEILYSEPEEYKKILREELQKGISYPKAREQAIEKYTNNSRYGDILLGANNILGIEYLKALRRLNETGEIKKEIIPIGIKREKVNHDSRQIIDNYASGTEVRDLCSQGRLEEVKKLVPKSSFEVLSENEKNGTYVLGLKDFEKEIIYRIRTMNIKEIEELPEVTEGLEYLIKETASKTNKLDELIDGIKSKRYTQTRIQRILLYALLRITKEDMEMSKSTVPYIRVLGLNENGKRLLSKIDSNNIITSVKKFEEGCTDNRYKRMLEIDKLSTDIYTMGYKKSSKGNLDYTMRNF